MTSSSKASSVAPPPARSGSGSVAWLLIVLGAGPLHLTPDSLPILILLFACLVVVTVQIAWRVSSRLLPRASASVFLLTVGLLVHAVAALAVLSLGLASGFVPWSTALAVGAVGVTVARLAGPPRGLREVLPELPLHGGYRWTTALVVLVLLGAFAIVALNQVRYTVQDADSMWYHLVMPAEWVRTGSLWPHEAVPTMAKGYPGFRQSLVALLSLPFGDEHLALLGLIEFPLLALATYVLARRFGADRTLAVLAGCCAATTPVVFAGLSTQGNDIALAIYLSAAVVFCLRFFDGGARGDGLVAGIALGALAACKFSGPGYCALVLATALVQHGFAGWWSWRNASVLAVGPLALAAPWYVRNWIALGNPLYPARLEVAGYVLDGPVDRQLLQSQTIGWNLEPILRHLSFFLDAHGAMVVLAAFGFLVVTLAVALRRRGLRASCVALIMPVLLFVMFLHHPFNLPRFDAGYSHRYLIAWFAVSLASLFAGVAALSIRLLTPLLSVVVVLATLAALRTVTGLWLPIGAAVVIMTAALSRHAVRERLQRWWRYVIQLRMHAVQQVALLALIAAGLVWLRADWQFAPGVGYRDGSSELGWGACMRYVHENVRDARVGLHGSHFLFPLIGEPWSNEVVLADQPLLDVPHKTLDEVSTWIDAERLDYLVCCRDRSKDPETGAWRFDDSIAAELRAASAPSRFETVFEDRGAAVLRVARR